MGTNNLSTKNDGDVISADDPNQFKTALDSDLVPRNSSGVPTDEAGDLGTSSLKWRRAEIASGFFFPGMMVPVHTYNDTVTPGQGWMKCDGRVINEENYNTEHGAGSWDKYIGSSDLDGKYLPDMTDNIYLAGTDETTQDGSSALTTIGESGSIIDFSHTHTVDHNHKYVKFNGIGEIPQIYDASGNLITPTAGANQTVDSPFSAGSNGSNNPVDLYTEKVAAVTSSAGGSTQSVKPESLEVIWYMRII